MCGMTLALRLAEAGHQVTLLEASDRLGGLADAWQVGNLTWDRHYHVTLLSDAKTRKVLTDIGVEQELHWCITKTGYFRDGQLVSMSNAMEYLRLPGLNLLQKMRLAWTIIYASRLNDWKTLENIPVEEWLTKLSGRGVMEGLWRPLLRAKLGDRYVDCSAAFLWATIKRLYAARESGLKTEKFGYVAGGYDAVVRGFERRFEALGVQVRLGSPVESIAQTGQGLRVQVGQAPAEKFERVVGTMTPRRAAAMCKGLAAEEQALLQGVEFQGLICASLVLKRPLADYYLTYLMDADLPFTAVIEMTAMVSPQELQGNHLIYLPLYLSAEDPRFQQSDDAMQATFIAGLKKVYPNFTEDDVLACRISRVAEVFPLPVLQYSEKVPPVSTSLPGLHLVNAAQILNGTLNVNETIGLAERCASHLLGSDGLAAEEVKS
jgi:protoporphyrinogen oxidase